MEIHFRNCRVHTMNRDRPIATSFAVAGNRIGPVGTDPDSRSVDLGGRTVIPGIIDSHTHFVSYCTDVLSGIDLGPACSLDEALQILSESRCEDSEGDEWIRGGGWDKNAWPGDAFPNRQDLDAVIPDRPVALYSRDCHALWLNSAALNTLGIGPETQSPPGGSILRDRGGEPTGILLDSALDTARAAIPQPTDHVVKSAVCAGSSVALSQGITGLVSCEGALAFRVLSSMARHGRFDLRTWITLPEDALDAATTIGITGGLGNDHFRILGLKVMLDGSLGSQTAYMDDPYAGASDTDYRGLLLHDSEQLQSLVTRAAALDLPAVIHAIGDSACEMAISALEALGRPDLRHRIEHAQLLRDDHPGRLYRGRIIASVQPSHLGDDIALMRRHWGERAQRAYALGSMMEAGVSLAMGSDVPVATMNPLLGMAHAAFRPDGRGGTWYPKQAISLYEALRGYTAGSAFAVGAEGRLGTLAPGSLADFVVLDRDPLEANSPEELLACRVDSTWVDGREVYRCEGPGLLGHRGS